MEHSKILLYSVTKHVCCITSPSTAQVLGKPLYKSPLMFAEKQWPCDTSLPTPFEEGFSLFANGTVNTELACGKMLLSADRSAFAERCFLYPNTFITQVYLVKRPMSHLQQTKMQHPFSPATKNCLSFS